MTAPQDQRRHERFGGTLTVQVSGDGTQRFGTIYEVSIGGAFIEVSPLPAEGAVVDIVVVENGVHIALRAAVRYRIASDVGPRGIEGVGVSWRELTPDGYAFVERMVSRAQAGRPLRGG